MSTEYQPLSPLEVADLRLKAERGELTAEDTKRFIESIRASFAARPSKAPAASKAKATVPVTQDVDFF